MIDVLLMDTQDKKNRIVSITTYGHSRAEVCVGVSVLAQTAAGYLSSLAECYPNEATLQLGRDGGVLTADLVINSNDDWMHQLVNTVVGLLRYGLRSIELSFPNQLDAEVLADMPEDVSRDDLLDCVHEWRQGRDIDPKKLKPPDFIAQIGG